MEHIIIDKSYIGKIIKNLRVSKKYTQEELSEKIGISKNYLSKVERGLSILNVEAFLKMATVLDFSLDDFGLKSNSTTSETKNKLIKRIISSTENETKVFVELLDTTDRIIKLLK